MKFQNITYTIPWNLFLITLGSLIAGIGLKAIVIPNGMITGGFSGAGILVFYYTKIFTPGIWYFILNIPVFIFGWIFVSRRFLLYSLYGAIVLTLSIDLIRFEIPVKDLMLAAMAGGAIIGAGAGIVFRSLGSAGGNDIIAIILNQKFGIRIGTYNFIFNFVLFFFSFGLLDTDLILYSMAMSYISSQVIEYFITLFNQRKLIFIISNNPRQIADEIMDKLNRGATFLKGEGAYSGMEKDIIMMVANTFQIKRVEEIAFTIDPDAFLITENTFNVLGKGFSKRKVY
ncbi:MAG: YitT family protein [Deltaproteobacteria bacterium]|uniref:YitT family protein n=1 Tax=Desulfobacula sp. TaxID=2593537 RepID=UPI0019B60069|nr:YitT family protein [Candidatus Desulfobacula maris]MBL6994681.1 YitT family protein [Desulfobacula sp.]